MEIPQLAPLLEVLETKARNLIPDEDTGFTADYQYVASAYIDDLWMKNYRIGTQSATIQTLGLLKAEAAVRPLIKELANEELRNAALAALIEMRGVAVPSMLDALKNDTNEVRVKVAEAPRNYRGPTRNHTSYSHVK